MQMKHIEDYADSKNDLLARLFYLVLGIFFNVLLKLKIS